MRKSADDHFNQNMQEMQAFPWIIDETWMEKGAMLNGYDHPKGKILKVLLFVASAYCLTIVSKPIVSNLCASYLAKAQSVPVPAMTFSLPFLQGEMRLFGSTVC